MIYDHLRGVSRANILHLNCFDGRLQKLRENGPAFYTINSLYDASISRSRSNPKKIYCIDHAMITSLSSGILVNSGHLLENLVFTALRRKYSKIYYYKTSTGKEVDFIVLLKKREKMLVQVCKSMAEEKTRKREISALTGAMKELDLLKGIIVTWNESEIVLPKKGSISVIPVWQFLLEWDNSVL